MKRNRIYKEEKQEFGENRKKSAKWYDASNENKRMTIVLIIIIQNNQKTGCKKIKNTKVKYDRA